MRNDLSSVFKHQSPVFNQVVSVLSAKHNTKTNFAQKYVKNYFYIWTMFFKSSCAIFVAVIMLSLCILATAAPYQELEPRKGHVPVYIRHGDEALSNIHPGLAEAFNEQTLKAENLVEEAAPATTVEAISDLAESSTVSDIASFDAIKAKDE